MRLFVVAKYAFSFILVCYCFSIHEISFKDILAQEHFTLLLCAFFINYFEYLLSSLRLYSLLITQKLLAPFASIFKWSMASRFFENFLPSSIGGDISKIYLLKRYFSEKSLLSLTVITLVDRAISLSALFLLSTLSLICFYKEVHSLAYFTFFACFSLLGTCIFYAGIYLGMKNSFLPRPFFRKICSIKKVGSVLRQGFLVLAHFRKKEKEVIKILLFSLLGQVVSLLCLFLVIWSDGQSISLAKAFFILPLAFVTNLFGVMGGIGIGTSSIAFCLSTFFSIENAYSLTFLFQSIQVLSKIPCIFFCLKGVSTRHSDL